MKYLPLILLLSGCAMSNDDIIVETKRCQAGGLVAQPIINGWTMRVTGIVCMPAVGKDAKP